MNLKKKLLALGLSLAMVLSLAACGQKAVEEKPAEQPAQTEEPSADDTTADGAEDAAAQPAGDTAAAEETPLTDPARMTANETQDPM